MCPYSNSIQQAFNYLVATIQFYINILTFMFVYKKNYTEYFSQEVGQNKLIVISSVGQAQI